jgi:hypothetical protein
MFWKKKTMWSVAYRCSQGHISGIDTSESPSTLQSWQPEICPACGESGKTLRRVLVKREYEEADSVLALLFSTGWIRKARIVEIKAEPKP